MSQEVHCYNNDHKRTQYYYMWDCDPYNQNQKSCAGTTKCGRACHKGENCKIIDSSTPSNALVKCDECGVIFRSNLFDKSKCS